MTEQSPVLDVDDVLDLHALQLGRYGGGDGVRDRGMLESAVAQPQATFDGAFMHDGLFAMAAAYLFHIVQNHPFIDGNKRIGLVPSTQCIAPFSLAPAASSGKKLSLDDGSHRARAHAP